MSEYDYISLIRKLLSGEISTEEFKRRTENQKEYLMGLIDAVVSKKISVPQFSDLYYQFALELARGFMDERDDEFFEQVREKLDWTVEMPAKEDRLYGYLDYEQFIEWLSKKKSQHSI